MRREKCIPYSREKKSIETSWNDSNVEINRWDFKDAIIITLSKNSKEMIGMSKHGESQQRNENYKN